MLRGRSFSAKFQTTDGSFIFSCYFSDTYEIIKNYFYSISVWFGQKISKQQALPQHAVYTLFTIDRLCDMEIHRQRAKGIGLFTR